MEYQQFRGLSQDNQQETWSRLNSNLDFLLLKQKFKPVVRTQITDANSKEAFLYEAIRAQVIEEIFNYPEKRIRELGRNDK